MFSAILKLVKKSLGIECELLEFSESVIPPSKQAFSKGRYKIRHTGFKELLGLSLKIAYEDPSYGTWRGYRIIGVDGSSLRVPNSKENIKEFGLFKPNGTEGKMPPIARVSLFVDLCTSMICNARIAAWNIGEQTLAEEQLPEVVAEMKALKQEQLLFVYDRGYPSLKFFKQHDELKVDFVFRIPRASYKKLWERVDRGEKDFDFVIKAAKSNDSHRVRVTVFTLQNGQQEVLVTSLFDREKFSYEDIEKIYVARWHIEECYKRLKVGAELENFSGINLEAILQEFWAHLVMCNVLSAYISETQSPLDLDQLPEYRLNFSLLFGVMREKLFQVVIGKCSPRKFEKLFDRAAQRAKVKVRPGRCYSRHKVGIPKRHHVFRRVC